MADHENWIKGGGDKSARGQQSYNDGIRRSVEMRAERAKIVEKANHEAGKREIGEARKAKKRASRASRRTS